MSAFPYYLYMPEAKFEDIFTSAKAGHCPKPDDNGGL